MIDVVVPKWGLTMEEAVLTSWLKREGDEVAVDEPLAEVAADKVDAEVESPAAGLLVELLVSAGDEVEPGQVIARIEPA